MKPRFLIWKSVINTIPVPVNFRLKLPQLSFRNLDISTKLVVVLAESGIIKPQRNNDITVGTTPIIFDYEHKHVLRDAITTTWGTPVENTGSTFPSPVTKSFTYTLKDEFIPANCDVIAFVYDDASYEILQAAEAEVMQK